jgi:hypothetical protein
MFSDTGSQADGVVRLPGEILWEILSYQRPYQ